MVHFTKLLSVNLSLLNLYQISYTYNLFRYSPILIFFVHRHSLPSTNAVKVGCLGAAMAAWHTVHRRTCPYIDVSEYSNARAITEMH